MVLIGSLIYKTEAETSRDEFNCRQHEHVSN